MKKLLILLVLTQVLFGAYRVTVTTTYGYEPSDVAQTEEVFFGEFKEYLINYQEITFRVVHGTLSGLSASAENLAKGLFKEGLKGGFAGAGIGLVYGGIQHIIDESKANQRYILMERVYLKNGSSELKSNYFAGDKNPVYTQEEIKQLIKENKESKGEKKAVVQLQPSTEENPVTISKTNDEYVLFKHKEQMKDTKTYKKFILETFSSITKYAEENDFKFFGFINEGYNHFEGFTMNTLDSFSFSSPLSGNGKTIGYLDDSHFLFKVVFFKEKQEGIFLFNVNSVKNEINQGI